MLPSHCAGTGARDIQPKRIIAQVRGVGTYIALATEPGQQALMPDEIRVEYELRNS